MINNNISVIVPTYNSEKTIYQCLTAINRQSLPPLEVIVVDDGSIDRTVEIAKEWAIVIPNTHIKGASGARNTGGYIAKGNIIAFTDSDCIPSMNWLKNIMSVFSDITIGAVGGGYSSGLNGSFWQLFCCEELKFRRKNQDGEVETLVSNNFACRKSLFLEEDGFPEQYPVCEDMLFSYKISKRSKIIWLSNNGVQHCFKDSLREYLKHQYFFGTESTRFFLKNPELVFINNHQGKTLYAAIIVAFLFTLSELTTVVFWILNKITLKWIFFGLFILLLLSHFLLYLRFICYLVRIKFTNIVKAYCVSLMRDLVCGLSIIDGISRTFVKSK